MLLSMLLFSFEDLFFKSVSQSFPPGLATLIYGLGGTVIFAVQAWWSGQAPLTSDALKPWLLIRSIFEIIGRLFFALALAFAPLSVSVAILQATPLVVTFAAVMLLGEKVGWRRWLAMAIGFVGVLIILRPSPEAFRWDALFALISVIGFAMRDLATRASPPKMSPPQLGVLGYVMLCLSGLIFMAFDTSPPRLPDTDEAIKLGLLIALGCLGYLFLTWAMRVGEIAVVTPFRYSRLLIGLVTAFFIFKERPDIWTLLGSALIVSSGIYTLLRSPKSK